jgi:hypothetical protein
VRPLLAAFLLVACSTAPSAAPASTPPAPTTTPTLAPPTSAPPTTVPTPTAPTSDGVWRQVPANPAVAGVEFSDITWNGTRFIATGRSDLGGTFLDSTDGLDWSVQVPAGGAWAPTSIAAGPTGIVAIGTIGDHFATFTSPDGKLWTPHPDAFPMPSLGTDLVELTDIVTTGDGWIVVGRRDENCAFDCGLTSKRAYVWTSPNGINWTRVPDQASLKGGGMNAITQAGAGFVAAGVSNGHAAIWSSPDGRDWSRVPDDPMFGPPGGINIPDDPSTAEPPVTAVGAAEGLGTYVVVGSSLAQDTCDPVLKDAVCPGIRAWWSTDGRTWTKGTIEGARDGQARGVVTATAGFLILGLGGGCPGDIGRSMDGHSWGCDVTDPSLADFVPRAAFASDTTEIAVGTTFFGEGDSAPAPAGTIWYRVGA